MSEAGVEVWRGGVATWECDAMGHLNVAFYVAKCMEAMASLAAELGMPHAYAPHADATLVPRELHTRFLREARPGAGLYITAGVLEIGESEARVLLLIWHASGDLAASVQLVVAHATARDGRVFPWPERIRAQAEALKVTVPEAARPRGIPLTPLKGQPSLPRARDLGLKRIGLYAFRPEHCDAFGRMKPELLMARVFDAVPHLSTGPALDRPGVRVGGVALEYRLVYADWPHIGDRMEIRSGAAGGDARVRRIVHWCLDPVTGRAWGGAEAVVAAFDLDARKIISLTDDELADWRARSVDGLAL